MSDKRRVIKVAAVQMECIPADKERNMQKGLSLVDEACEKGARFVVLPELFSTGYWVKERDIELAESIPGQTTNCLAGVAKQRGICIATAILEHAEARGVVYDTGVFISPDGILGKYRKVFLWDSERSRFKHGHSFPVFDSGFGKVGIQMCYEVGFPEGARILSLKGADILAYPSAFGAPRLYVWDIATRSRAIENGSFLIAADLSGREDNIEFAGHSRIINPKGEILAEATDKDEIIVSEIDLALIPEQRRAVPYLRDYDKLTLLQALQEV